MTGQEFRAIVDFEVRASFPRERAERIVREVLVHTPEERVPLLERICFLCGLWAPELIHPASLRAPVQEPLCRPCARACALASDEQAGGARPVAEMTLADVVRALRAAKRDYEKAVVHAERALATPPAAVCWSCGQRFDARPIVGGARPICSACVEVYRVGGSCPCCGYATLTERAAFNLCAVCFWEDDGQDDANAGDVRGGPNGALSLDDARRNYLSISASESRLLGQVRIPGAREPQLRRYEVRGGAAVRVPLV